MVGLESKCDLTREDMMFVLLGAADEVSDRILGFEGRRPRRPLRLSVRTTSERGKKLSYTGQLLHLTHSISQQLLLGGHSSSCTPIQALPFTRLLFQSNGSLPIICYSHLRLEVQNRIRATRTEKKFRFNYFSNSKIKLKFWDWSWKLMNKIEIFQ